MSDEVTEAAMRLIKADPGVWAEAVRLIAQELGAKRLGELLDQAQAWADTDPEALARRLGDLAAKAARGDSEAMRELLAFSEELTSRARPRE